MVLIRKSEDCVLCNLTYIKNVSTCVLLSKPISFAERVSAGRGGVVLQPKETYEIASTTSPQAIALCNCLHMCDAMYVSGALSLIGRTNDAQGKC